MVPVDDRTLTIVLKTLRMFRESRDIRTPEARFLGLAAAAEHLTRANVEKRRLQGIALRDGIAELACRGERDGADGLRRTVADLWDHARNPLAHSAESFASIRRHSKQDIAAMEKLVFNMIEATALEPRVQGIYRDADAYDLSTPGEIGSASAPVDLSDLSGDDGPF